METAAHHEPAAMRKSPTMTVHKSAKTAAAEVVEFVDVAAPVPEAREESKMPVSTEVRGKSPANEARDEPEAADKAASAPIKK